MNRKKMALALGFALILATAHTLRAQTGCDDSPEDPTIILAMLAFVATFAVTLRRLGRGIR